MPIYLLVKSFVFSHKITKTQIIHKKNLQKIAFQFFE